MRRRLFRLLVVLGALVVIAVIAVFLLTNTEFGRERVRRNIVGLIAGQTHGIVRVDELHGDLLSGATLVRVAITDSAGHPFLKADSIALRYIIRSFFSQHLDFSDVIVYHPDVVVARLGDGPWNYRILWPSSPPHAPGDTLPGWGSWVKLTNVTVLNGNVTVRSPWAPRPGLTAHVRDSVIKDALRAGSRLYIAQVGGLYQKVVTLERVNARMPLVRWADPSSKNRYVQVSALSMDAFPFRPPAAKVRALTGNFTFNDDSLWWKGAAVQFPRSAMKGDGSYNLNTGDLSLTLGVSPMQIADFQWVYPRLPSEGGGTMALGVAWRGATQDYVVRNADIHTGGAHVQGDIGVTMTDTVFYHDANVRFSGVTTKQIVELDSTMASPRQGVLSGRAKFSGTPKWMTLDADVTFAAYGRGTSRVIATGQGGYNGRPVVVSARDLRVRVAPLQIDIVKLLFPTLPVAGTLTGVATLNGSGSSQLVATSVDMVHQDGANVSRATGRGSFHTLARQTMDLDLIATPFALAELTKFAPALPLKGLAYGPVKVQGPIDSAWVDTHLSLPGRGLFALRGVVDFLSQDLGYDIVADATALNLSRVMIGGTPTSLNGTVQAKGRGFKPATMYSDLVMDFAASSIDTISVDSLSVRAHLADGMANIERAQALASGARAEVSGQIGLDTNHTGSLKYSIVLDSLATFARFIPGASAPDTGVVRPRPRRAYEALRRARADSVRVARATEVMRAIRGAPGVRLRLPVDTPRAIPRGLLEGSLTDSGTVTGSVDRFSLSGAASGKDIVVLGNSVKHLRADYAWTDARTTSAKITASMSADTVSAAGFAFDSLSANVSYLAPGGTVALRVRQGAERDYALNGEFTIDTLRSELRLANIALRFDTTAWRSTHTSTIRFGKSGVEVQNLELTNGPGRRIYANGLLPTKGEANFELQVSDFAVENVAELLQSDLPVAGRLTLDARVSGVAEDPRMSGKLDFVRGTFNEVPVPEVHGTFAYASRQLTTKATAVDTTGKLLASVDGTIPIDLALSGVTGSRLLDRPINVTLISDSLPIGLIPQFTAAVTDVAGEAMGKVTVGGTLTKPVLNGNLTLHEAQFRVAATGALFEHLNGSVRMTGDSVFVDSIAGSSGGPVRVYGTVGVGSWREPVFNLTATASDATFLKNSQGEVHADVALKVVGPLSGPNVTGQVTVLHGVIYVPESSGKKVIGSDDPSLFNVVDTTSAVQRDLFPAQSAMFKHLRMNVDFVVDRSTWVRSRDANVEIFTDGPMQVSVVGDALTLTGALNADLGEYTFLSKRFQIKRGSALFIGTPDLNPTLQITAEYQVKQATGATNIRVLIGGTLAAPRISLESDAQPPLSQSDLLSYLAFGERSTSLLQFNSTSLSAQQGGNLLNLAGTRLAGIALGVALDELEGNAARSLGVDVFNITPGDIPLSNSQGGLDQFLKGTEIEAGRYVTPQTYVSAIATPGVFSCAKKQNENSSCAAPGASITHRTAKGYRFEVGLSPRYLLDPPTLAGQTYVSKSQFGAFIIREWRF
jgi:translocation and assembly module TamB